MHRDVEAELLHHSKSLRTLARALVGDQHADDLLQDVALQALQRGPARPGPMRAWLAAIARHFAGKQRRAAHNRARFEPQAELREPDWPPDRLAEQQESIDRLHAAFRALPEPCRGTLQLRFFEGLTPSEIAGATGVPLATVKSRLQRGLGLLRERLDAEGRGDWRTGLAIACGLHTTTAASAIATTVGGWLMGTGIKIFIGAAAAFLLAVGIGSLSAPAPNSQRPQATAAAVAPIGGGDQDAASMSTAEAADRSEVAIPSRADAATATIRGRCVDALHAPIAGIRIELEQHGGGRHQSLLHTATDGCFEFHFAGQSRGWGLSLRRDGDAAILTASWRTVQADQCIDLGDIVVPDLVTVHGSVVDAAGAPVLSPELNVSLAATVDALPHAHCGIPHIAPDGSFTVRLPPGDYLLNVAERHIVRGERLRVPAVAQQVRTKIVVDELEPDRRITGIVVGEQDEPLADVRISGYFTGSHRSRAVQTARDGRFELVRASSEPPIPLSVMLLHDGYAPLVLREPTPWGSRDLRLQMLPASRFELHVTDAAHRPVERYGLRLWPAPGTAAIGSSTDARRRANGPHQGGIASVAGMARGEHYLIVEPDADELCASELRLLSPTATSMRVDVQLLPIATRTVHVERADGTAAAGVEVLLLDAPARPVTLQTEVCNFDELWQAQPDTVAVQLQKLTTDAHGDATLRGPADRRCALKLPDPGHPPLLVPDVDLTAPTPLLVRLAAGARLEGRLVPAAAVAAARAMAIAYIRDGSRITPGLRLLRNPATNGEQVPDQDHSGVPIAADGSFTFAGVAGGNWQLILETPLEGPLQLAEVRLSEGQTTTTTVTMPDMTPAQLDGLVLRNGVPMADADLQILIGRDLMGTGKPVYRGAPVHTDADGRFHFAWSAGTFTINQLHYTATAMTSLRANEEVTLAAGGSATQTFHLEVGTLQLRLLDSRGRPVAGVPLTLLDGDGNCRHQTEPTDADGRVRCDAEDSHFTVAVLPRRLLDPKLQQEMRADKHGIVDPFAELRLRLGDVAARAGTSQEYELRLPAEWGR